MRRFRARAPLPAASTRDHMTSCRVELCSGRESSQSRRILVVVARFHLRDAGPQAAPCDGKRRFQKDGFISVRCFKNGIDARFASLILRDEVLVGGIEIVFATKKDFRSSVSSFSSSPNTSLGSAALRRNEKNLADTLCGQPPAAEVLIAYLGDKPCRLCAFLSQLFNLARQRGFIWRICSSSRRRERALGSRCSGAREYRSERDCGGR